MRLASPVFATVVISLAQACAPEGPTAFVQNNIPPDSKCTYSPSSEFFLPIGEYDIAAGSKDRCKHPYQLHLVVDSFLRSNSNRDLGRAEPNVLQVKNAQVELQTLDGATIAFGDGTLPNPFLVVSPNTVFPTTDESPSPALVTVEAIPMAYAEFLPDLVGTQIIAKIQLFGTTTGDVDVDFQTFEYPISICEGCNIFCGTDVPTGEAFLDQLPDDQCFDNNASDGRVCYDPDC
jgi:hypothetical protein